MTDQLLLSDKFANFYNASGEGILETLKVFTPHISGSCKKDHGDATVLTLHFTDGSMTAVAANENKLVAYGFPNIREFLLAAAGDPPNSEGPLALAVWHEARRLTLLAFDELETSDAKH